MEDEKETKLRDLDTRIKNLKSKLRYSKSPLEQRTIRSNIGRLEKEIHQIKNSN